MRRPSAAFGLAAGLYLCLTLALTWPLALHMGSRVPNDLGDSLLNMFLLAWDARVVPFSAKWWSLPQFYPIPGVMAFSEHLLGLSVITTPVIAATGSVLAAYNVAFLLSFFLSAIAAHLLCFELTRRHDLAMAGALAYAFAPYRMSQFAHLQVLSAYWIPLALYGLHRYLRAPRWRWAVLFAASWLLQALACGYYLFYLSVLVGMWIGWFAIGRMRALDLGRLLAAWAVAIAALIPMAMGYVQYQSAYGLRRWPYEIEAFSADIASLLTAPPNLRLWGWLQAVQRPESELFPGLVLPVTIIAGAALAWTAAARTGVRRLRAPRVLLLLAAVFALVAATPLWFGPWRLEIGGVRFLSVGGGQKPFSIAVLLAIGAVAMHPSMRIGWSRRSPLAFYCIGAAAMWTFSLGPTPTFLNEPLLYKAPYSWLMQVPGVEGVRVPARFWVLSTMCLAVAGALALRHAGGQWRSVGRVLPAIVAVILLVESWPQPLMLEPEPAPRPAHARAVARLDLPISQAHDLIVLYRAIAHQRPVVNGYSGYFAPHYRALQHQLERRDPAVFAYLTSLGPIEVIVDHDFDPDGSWRTYVQRYAGSEVVHQGEAYTAYELPRSSAASSLPNLPGQPLAIADIRASRSQDRVGLMLDGNRITRWDTSGAQSPGDQIVIDLGAAALIAGVELQVAGYVSDFPRELAIDVSDDQAAWRQVWSGSTGLLAVMAAIEDPLNIPLRIPLDASGRYVRLRQLGTDQIYYWSVAELRLFGT